MCLAGVVIASALTASCRPAVHELDGRELEHPELAQAVARGQRGEIDAAIDMINKFLNENPAWARAHLELALLYDHHGVDRVRAIYHYQRYLEMRPDTEKRTMLEERMAVVRRELAAAYGFEDVDRQARIEALETENRNLQDALAALQRDRDASIPITAAADAPLPDPAPVVEPLDEPTPTPIMPRDIRYTVQERDSLSSLARQFYGDARRWQKIYDANRERITNPNVLPVGVAIVIPDVVPATDD